MIRDLLVVALAATAGVLVFYYAEGPYSTASLPNFEPSDKDKQKQFEAVRGKIDKLRTTLKVQTDVLKQLHHDQKEMCKGFWWFLDASTQQSYRREQMKINDQERVVVNIREDIDFQWEKLKPVFGIWSKLFIEEALFTMASLMSTMIEILFPFPLTFSLAALLMLGPVALVVLLLVFSIGWTLLPVFITAVCVTWAVKIPVVMAQYQPTKFEFVVVYLLLQTVLGLAVWGAVQLSLMSSDMEVVDEVISGVFTPPCALLSGSGRASSDPSTFERAQIAASRAAAALASSATGRPIKIE